MALNSGDMLYYDGTNWVNSSLIFSAPSFYKDDSLTTSVNYPLSVQHTITGPTGVPNKGAGAVGIGSGVAFSAESSTAGTTIGCGYIDCILIDPTAGAQSSRTDIVVWHTASIVRPLQIAHQKVTIPQGAASVAANGLFNLGDGPFDGSPGGFAGSSNGTVIAINTSSGYLGRLCEFEVAGSSKFWVGSGGMCWVVNLTHSGSTLGFYNQPVVTRQSVTGSRGSQTVTVLTNLLTALNTVGIIQDSTTA